MVAMLAAIFTKVAGGSGNYSYKWTGVLADGTTAAVIDHADEANISQLEAGTYTLHVEDKSTDIKYAAAGVTTFIERTFTVTQPTEIEINGTVTHVTCSAAGDGQISVTVTGGVAPYTYDWGEVVGQSTATISGLNHKTYTVTVTDNNGCKAQQSFDVYEPYGD